MLLLCMKIGDEVSNRCLLKIRNEALLSIIFIHTKFKCLVSGL